MCLASRADSIEYTVESPCLDTNYIDKLIYKNIVKAPVVILVQNRNILTKIDIPRVQTFISISSNF
jgi:hypothetical protein